MIGHIILINSIVAANRGGQIIKLFNFINNFPGKFLEINSLIDIYKSDKFFTIPKNVCTWNPYQGIYEVKNKEDQSDTIKFGLYDMVTMYNSIPPTEGNELLYVRNGIFKAFKLPDDVDNARDDLDLRIKSIIDKDKIIFNEKKILEGVNLFTGTNINPSIIKRINDKIKIDIDGTNLGQSFNFFDLYFPHKNYIPNIHHYFNFTSSKPEDTDENFITIGNRKYDFINDIYDPRLNFIDNKVKFYSTNKQFLDINKTGPNKNTVIHKSLFEILSFDLDDLSRNLSTPYIGCFDKQNYCKYNFSLTGQIFSNNKFSDKINCCENNKSTLCSGQKISSGLNTNFSNGNSPGLFKPLM